MLQSIREGIRGWLAYVIVFLISIPFVLWGIGEYLGGGGENYVAQVDGTKIPPRAFEEEYLRTRQRLQQQLSDQVSADFFQQIGLKQRVLDGLIDRELLRQAAAQHGLRAADDLVLQRLSGFDVFRENGQFSRSAYEAQLQSVGLSPGRFESQLRQDLTVSQIRQGLQNSAFITEQGWREQTRLRGQERRLGWLRVESETFETQIQPDNATIRQYYEANADQFRRPERVRVAYLKLSAAQIADSIEPTTADLKALYQEEKQRYTTEERRTARHILLTSEENGDSSATDSLIAEARSLRAQILNDEATFAELARAHSDDPGSAPQGGQLGEVARGMMVEPFENALFNLEESGAISQPVETQFGVHLIKLEAIEGGSVEPFEAVRGELAADYRRREADDLFYDQYDTLVNLAYENPNSLQPAAQQLGLEIQTTDWFTASNGDGIASTPKVRQTAFSDELLNERMNSDPVEVGTNEVVVLRVEGHEPPQVRPLDEVRAQVVRAVTEQQARSRAASRGRSLAERLRDDPDVELSALSGNAEAVSIHDLRWFGRNASDLPLELRRAAFAVPLDSNLDKPHVVTAQLSDGDYTVARLTDVRPGSSDAPPEQERRRIEQAWGDADFQAFLQGLRARADIEVKEDL